MSKYSNNVLGCTALVASGTRYSHRITESVETMGLALLCRPFAWIPAISLSCMELLLFNLLKLVSYFPGCLHGNVATQLFTLLSRYKWLNCTTDVA